MSVPVETKKKGMKKKRSPITHIPLTSTSGLGDATPVGSSSRDDVQRAALLASVVGQSFEDVKFWAYSRRTLDGAVDNPLPLLANSRLVRKTSSHFGFLLAATGFAENGIADMDSSYPLTRPSSTAMYDYASDSDLEDEEEPITKDELPPVVENGIISSGSRAQAEEEKQSEVGGKVKQMADPDESEEGATKAIARPGRIVFLEDIAYATWKAFIVYAYFGEVKFAPLKSENKACPSHTADPHELPQCSPKSMYRLAEKYDIPALKEEALKSIQSKLSPHNILEEIFSTFTSLYPAVQAIELDYLHANSNDTGIRARLPKWLEAMEDGLLPRGAAGIVASLFDKFTAAPQNKPCPYGCKSSTSNYCNNCGRTYT